jgi:hypothetical protein
LTARAHAMGAGVAVAGEGMGLTRGGRESPREHGANGVVPLGREGKGERASGARCRQGGRGGSKRERGNRARAWDDADRRGLPVREGRTCSRGRTRGRAEMVLLG